MIIGNGQLRGMLSCGAIVLGLGMNLTAIAQNETESTSTTTTTTTKKETTTPAAQPEVTGSNGARMNKMAGVEVGYGGVISILFGTQVHGYYNISSDWSVGLLYNSGSLDLSSALSSTGGDVSIKEANLTGSMIGVATRYFVGNSFYVMGGLAQRTISLAMNLQSTQIDYGLKGTVDGDSMVAVVGLGNQWQWGSGFSLGCEWFGYALPLSSSGDAEFKETGAAAAAATAETKADLAKLQEDSKDAGNTFGETGTFRLLVLSLGWAF